MSRSFLSNWLLPVWVGLLSFVATSSLSAQCGISFSQPTLTLPLNGVGSITLDELSASPAVAPNGTGCYLVFSFDDQFTTTFTSKTFDCTEVGNYSVYVRSEDGVPANTSPSFVVLTVMVVDNVPPTFTSCPVSFTANTDGTNNANSPCVYTHTSALTSTVVDNAPACLSIGWTINNSSLGQTGSGSGTDVPANTTFALGVNTVSITATDAGNQTTSCVFTVTVEDDDSPTITCPADITYTANNNCQAIGDAALALTASMVADNCTDDATLLNSVVFALGTGTFSMISSPGTAVGSIFSLGNTMVRYEVEDEAGNTRRCALTVIVEDKTVPSIAMQDTVYSTLDVGFCDSEVLLELTGFSDNCTATNSLMLQMEVDFPANSLGYTDIPLSAYDAAQLLYFPLGESLVTFYVTDAAGNTGIHAVRVIVTDDEPPVFFNTPIFGQDGCGTTITVNNTPGNCSNTFSWHRPNFFTAQFFPFVPDIFECNSPLLLSVVETISNTQVEQAVPFYDPFNGYYLNPITQSNSVNPTAQFPIGETTITYTTYDNFNNTATCSFKVVVKDVESPNLVCPPTQTMSTICPDAKIPDYRSLAQVSDNCPSSVQLTQSPIAPATLGSVLGVPNIGSTYTVTLTGTDAGGNTNTCTFMVELNDDGDSPVPTVASLPSIIDSCGQLLVPAPTATFPCNPNSPILYGSTTGSVVPGSNPPVYVFNPGSYIVTWVYNFGNPNISTQTQNITVLPDTFPPVALCKPLVRIPLQADGDTTIFPQLINNGSYDPTTCNSPLTFAIAGQTLYNCGDIKDTTTVILQVRDDKNNLATCTSKIVVFDNTPPKFNNTPNATVNVQSCNNIPAVANVTATDVCTPTTLTYQADTIAMSNILACRKYNFNIVRTWTATDTFNNVATFVQTIRVRDTQAPSFAGVPNNQIISTGANAMFCGDTVKINVRNGVTDCATGVDLVITPNNGQINNFYSVGQHSILFTATDACANSATHIQTFTVEDATPPVPICNNAISTSVNLAGTVTLTPQVVNNGSFDNCGITDLVISPNTFDCDDADGTTKHKVRLTVTDAAGNTSACETDVTVFDYVAPIITNCPANVTVACSADTTTTGLGNVSSTDNCLNTLVTTHTNSMITFGQGFGTFVRTFKVTDGNGNTATCSQTIQLNDTTAPTLSQMPANITIGCPSDMPSLPVIFPSDNCDPAPSLTFTPFSTRVLNVKACGNYTYFTTRTWTSTDVYGNTKVHTQTITVKDTIAPSITLPADTIFWNSASFPAQAGCTVPVDFNLNDFIADCVLDSNLSVQVFGAPFGNGGRNISGNYPVGNYKIYIAATDPCGNTAQDSIVFVVRDNSVPTMICNDNIVISLGSQGTASLMTADVNIGSSDNCGLDTLYLSKSLFDCGDIGKVPVTLFGTDIYGNTNSCTVDVQVEAGSASTISLALSSTPASYFGNNDGTATAMVTGGSGNYTYHWHNNGTTATITGLAAGVYFLTVTDQNTNCVATGQVAVGDGQKVTFSAGTVAGAQGTMITVPVTTQQFNSLLSAQFSIHVNDANVAEVLEVVNVHPSLDIPNVLDFVANITGNDVGIVWATSTGQGVTLQNNTVVFEIKVLLSGAANTTTPVTFDNTPVDVDIFQLLAGVPTQVPVVFNAGQIQVNSGTPDVKIGGLIHTWKNPEVASSVEKPVANVNVNLTGTQTANQTTLADGLYNFTVNSGNNTLVSCSKVTNGNTGSVTAGDLLRIVNQIFGDIMPSPYQWVAADVNEDGKVTLADYVIIQQLALGTVQHLATAPDWKFIPESYVFANPPLTPANPVPYPQSIEHNPVLQDFLNDNFVAVRMGDVNGNTIVTLTNDGTDDRYDNTEKMIFSIDDRTFKAGETFVVPVRAKGFTARQAYQFTIVFDTKTLSFENVEMAGVPNLTEENFGFANLNSGYLTTVWVNRDPVTLQDGEVMFYLTFKSKAEKKSLSSVLRPGSEITRAEAYDAAGNTQSIDFEYILPTQGGEKAAFELYPNQPNPFRQFTDVNFRLPENTTATLRISNVAGQVVRTIEGDFVKGWNALRIDRQQLGKSGVYFLELNTGTESAQIKMILID